MDPFTLLGLPPSASEQEVTQAYRTLVKALHPDRPGAPPDASVRMERLNVAYASARKVAVRTTADREAAPRALAWWLDDQSRVRIGAELAAALEERERVFAVTQTALGGLHDVRLLVSDRRVLWLRNDAITDRVDGVRVTEITGARVRRARWRTVAGCTITTPRRVLRFGEIELAGARALSDGLITLLGASRVSVRGVLDITSE